MGLLHLLSKGIQKKWWPRKQKGKKQWGLILIISFTPHGKKIWWTIVALIQKGIGFNLVLIWWPCRQATSEEAYHGRVCSFYCCRKDWLYSPSHSNARWGKMGYEFSIAKLEIVKSKSISFGLVRAKPPYL